MLPLLLLLAPAQAEEIILQNDSGGDSWDTSDGVVWLAYPECAISVLTPDDPADYPLDIDRIQVAFSSNTGNHENESTLVVIGLQFIDEGAAPSGRGDWVWGEEAFSVTVSSAYINELTLSDPDAGWTAPTLESGSVAVWVCAPDPDTGYSWPKNSDADASGIVLDLQSSSVGNYLFYQDDVFAFQQVGLSGSWVIRAASGESTGSSGGSGGDSGGDGSYSGDGGSGDGGGGTDTGAGDGGLNTDGGIAYEGDEAEECRDGADNDLDGDFDCDDDGCEDSPDCTGGCSCTVTPTATPVAAALGVFLLGLVGLARRRE